VTICRRRATEEREEGRGPGRVAALSVVPKSGMIIPEMGMQRRDASLAGALFTPVQQRVLGLLFGQPDRTFQSAEIIRLAGSGTGAVHRQLSRLEASGLVSVRRSGNQKFYQANPDSPIHRELTNLVVKTVGITDPIRHALAARRRDIQAAFVYGSVAKRSDRATSDIDLMVITDKLGYAEVFDALQRTDATLGRHVNPTVMSLREWRVKRKRKDSFVARVAGQPKLFVIGSDSDLV
jgi:predicted nucleotidyltransferase